MDRFGRRSGLGVDESRVGRALRVGRLEAERPVVEIDEAAKPPAGPDEQILVVAHRDRGDDLVDRGPRSPYVTASARSGRGSADGASRR